MDYEKEIKEKKDAMKFPVNFRHVCDGRVNC